jgi:DNA-binding Lrp family transcriptional regulator
MISNDRINRRGRASFTADALDLRVMELLAEDGSLSYKQLAEKLKVDKRTVSKHLEALKRNGAVRITAEIDWSLIGVNAFAFVGTIRNEPRVIEAYSTLGSDEYFLVVLDRDLQTLREEVLRKLEPLTADLSTAIVSTRIKAKDYAAFLSFLRKRRELASPKSAAKHAPISKP